MNNQPNYVLKTNEAVLMPTEVNKGKSTLKICVWVIVGIIILGSFLLQDNLFAEMSWPVRIFLIVLVIGFGFYGGKKEYMPSPMELQFYEDHLVLYLPKRYYSNRVTRKETSKMNYADITKCKYLTQSKRIHIYGNGVSTWWNYDKAGNVPETPSTVRNFTEGLIYFNTSCAEGVDFVKEIEEHSPIKVIIENS